jgi:hypothetical protein
MAGHTAQAVSHEDRSDDRTRAAQPETRAQEADLTYGCVDWFIYEDDELKRRRKTHRLGPMSVRS